MIVFKILIFLVAAAMVWAWISCALLDSLNSNLILCMIVASLAFALSAVYAYVYPKWINGEHSSKRKPISPYIALFIGILAAGTLWFFPAYASDFDEMDLSVVSALFDNLLASVQHSVRLFSVDDNYLEVLEKFKEEIPNIDSHVYELYAAMGNLLFFCAPIMTFSVILSFFKNLSAYWKYKRSFLKEAHIFSELNEKSLALAQSIDDKYNKKGDKKRKYKLRRKALIVFADIIDKNEEEHLDLIESAKSMGAVLFRKDISSIGFSKRTQTFYLINDDESEKMRHAANIIENYKDCDKTKLYIFSDNSDVKGFLDSYDSSEKKKMKLDVIRVNDIRALIYGNLKDNGIRLFEKANKTEGNIREISAVIIGLGKYGIETLKALLWYTQIPGYRVNITAIDEDEDVVSRFKAMCPGIDPEKSYDAEGDARYTVKVINSKVGTKKFLTEIGSISKPTYIFVCLGSDSKNLSASVDIRCFMESLDRHPDIETVVYDSNLKRRFGMPWSEAEKDQYDVNDASGKNNIHIIGDLETFYSEKTVIAPELSELGFDIHQRWDTGESAKKNFYMNDYNYFSSMSSALHRDLKKKIISYNDELTDMSNELKRLENEPGQTEKYDKLKEEYEKKKLVFAYFHNLNGDEAEASNAQKTTSRQLLLEMLKNMQTNLELRILSKRMNDLSDVLYAKLAHVHYNKISDESMGGKYKNVIVGKFIEAQNKKAEKKGLIALTKDDFDEKDECKEEKFEEAFEEKIKDSLKDLLEYDKSFECYKKLVISEGGKKLLHKLFDTVAELKSGVTGENFLETAKKLMHRQVLLSPEGRKDVRIYMRGIEAQCDSVRTCKLAHVYYGELSDDEKFAVWKKCGNKRPSKTDDFYRTGLEAYGDIPSGEELLTDENKKKIFKDLFDKIAAVKSNDLKKKKLDRIKEKRLSLSHLSKDDKKDVRNYMKEVKERLDRELKSYDEDFIKDILKCKLAVTYYNGLSKEDKLNVRNTLKNSGIIILQAKDGNDIDFFSSIPDTDNLLNAKAGAEMDRFKTLFEVIEKIKTDGVASADAKHDAKCSLEYAALEKDDKIEVCKYVAKFLGCQNAAEAKEALECYFSIAQCFADVEHIRWNAYIRSEGHRCAPERKKEFKMHFDLVNVDKLTFADMIKDI